MVKVALFTPLLLKPEAAAMALSVSLWETATGMV
jgi:hypothetical protein